MLNVEDFTSLQRGFEVPLEGRIETCPRCGRNGIEERPECAAPYFLHVQATDACSATACASNLSTPARCRSTDQLIFTTRGAGRGCCRGIASILYAVPSK